MNGLSAQQILLDGIIFSIGLNMILLGGMYLNPRIMLTDYPPQIQAQVPPMNASEKRQQVLLGILFWGFALIVLFYSNAQLVARSGGEAAFLPLFLNTYLVFEIFNLVDLLVLDYLVLMVLKPRRLFIPGVEGMEQYNTFGYHFKGFLKGLGYGVVVSVVVALIALVVM